MKAVKKGLIIRTFLMITTAKRVQVSVLLAAWHPLTDGSDAADRPPID